MALRIGLCQGLKQFLMLGLLAWALVLLGSLSVFSDLPLGRPSQSAVRSRSHPQVQHSSRVIMASQTESATAGPTEPRRGGDGATRGREAPSSKFSHLGPPHRRIRLQQQRRLKMRRSAMLRRRRKNGRGIKNAEEGLDWEARHAVRGLWNGSASARMLSPRLKEAAEFYVNDNKHKVDYRGPRRAGLDGKQILCQLKEKARLRTLDGSEEPFSSLGWGRLVPPQALEKLPGAPFKTCAVVASAGAILNSMLGKEIDSHDAVVRFNAAPTESYERDVGRKTTIRIMNSQILTDARHNFSDSPLYRNVSLVAWDPAPYTADLYQWFQSPDYNLFTPYETRRKASPSQHFYVLHPAFIWSLWDVIQSNSQEDIQPNPPSSGFIGIIVMMTLCDEVDVYEYIPSVRQTSLCHYYEGYFDNACTLGAYHPLLYEKTLIRRMSRATEEDLKRKGKATLPGFHTVTCPP
ncbi:beta-galactoside alpha-2,6-sialyltransferase 2b [Chanos chanos]|uniref:Beta-galactoside alpha-2,6-sialyltransferase 2 n=1 Tax=Chanos chanos TaxID=29144 RepID=A0A6J2VZZ0_CHACN|nr:beta-galactoside alpha-2,6-sialyltransferase 2-like [Chanos chanos]